MTQHTPGPWYIENTTQKMYDDTVLPTFNIRTKAENAYIVAKAHPIEDGQLKTAEANARLIAAAPEMLEALEAALYVLDELTEETLTEDSQYLAQFAIIRTAIKKAKGE